MYVSIPSTVSNVSSTIRRFPPHKTPAPLPTSAPPRYLTVLCRASFSLAGLSFSPPAHLEISFGVLPIRRSVRSSVRTLTFISFDPRPPSLLSPFPPTFYLPSFLARSLSLLPSRSTPKCQLVYDVRQTRKIQSDQPLIIERTGAAGKFASCGRFTVP